MGLISRHFFFFFFLLYFLYIYICIIFTVTTIIGSKCYETIHLLPKIIILKQEMIFLFIWNAIACLRGGLGPSLFHKSKLWLGPRWAKLADIFHMQGYPLHTHTLDVWKKTVFSLCICSISKGLSSLFFFSWLPQPTTNWSVWDKCVHF